MSGPDFVQGERTKGKGPSIQRPALQLDCVRLFATRGQAAFVGDEVISERRRAAYVAEGVIRLFDLNAREFGLCFCRGVRRERYPFKLSVNREPCKEFAVASGCQLLFCKRWRSSFSFDVSQGV